MVAALPEPEALRLAVVFEETGAYTYRKNREVEQGGGGSVGESETVKPGLKEGFEEIFSFGEEDNSDYWDKTIIDENGNVERNPWVNPND